MFQTDPILVHINHIYILDTHSTFIITQSLILHSYSYKLKIDMARSTKNSKSSMSTTKSNSNTKSSASTSKSKSKSRQSATVIIEDANGVEIEDAEKNDSNYQTDIEASKTDDDQETHDNSFDSTVSPVDGKRHRKAPEKSSKNKKPAPKRKKQVSLSS